MGIKLVTDPENIHKNANCIVQKYIDRPMLINNVKYAKQCNARQCIATHCNILQHITTHAATHCNTLADAD